MPLKAEEQKKNSSQSAASDQAKFVLYQYFWVIDILVALIVLAAGTLFFLLPRYRAIESDAQLQQVSETINKKSEYLGELRGIIKLYEDISPENKSKINAIVNNTSDEASLVSELDYLVSKHGGSSTVKPVPTDASFRPDVLSNNQRQGGLSRQITKTVVEVADISYNGLQGILRDIESNLRIMDVIRVEYNPGAHSARLEILTYQTK
jgi:hypothetical protein